MTTLMPQRERVLEILDCPLFLAECGYPAWRIQRSRGVDILVDGSDIAGHKKGAEQSGDIDPILDLDQLKRDLSKLSSEYQAASPFPHLVFDDFLVPGIVREATNEFLELDKEFWNGFAHVNERKFSHTDPSHWGPSLRQILEEFNSDLFVVFLSQLTGIDDLMVDHTLEGGGLHRSNRGGFLNIHADFTVHPHKRNWRRRVNLLLYLNEDWKPEYGGDLELWSRDMSRCEEKVAPVSNRVVIFSTDEDSFHGHPEPMTCPEDRARRSMALYYFTAEENPVVGSTNYRARPGDGLRSIPIYLDKQLLHSYDWLKRHLGFSDEAANKLFAMRERIRRRGSSK